MRKLLVLLAIAGMMTIGGGVASATTMLFDRGLPTANLNSSAGSDRSNVAWADWETSNSPEEYWLPGDDIILSGSGMYHIDTVRVWTIADNTDGLSLWAGSDVNNGGIFSNYTATQVSYNSGVNYQGSSGASRTIYQLDFAINEDVAAGTYYFFLDGPWSECCGSSGNGYVNPYLHASNAALSGSTQEGADDAFQWLHINNSAIVGVESWYSSGSPTGTTGWGSGWDKNSDANVQVFGTAPVPEPSTILLMGIGLLGLVGYSRKRKKS